MSSSEPVLTAAFWRTRRAAAIAGIIFGVLLLAAMIMTHLALTDAAYDSLQDDGRSRRLIVVSLHLVPFAGIAFLWFIGVVREHLGEVEDRLFSTVFMGSGLLFLALLFTGAVTSASLVEMLDGTPDADVWAYGRDLSHGLVSFYAMRMAAVFTLSVSTAGLRSGTLPRWVAVLGYVVSLALLLSTTATRWIELLFPAWVLLVSIVILWRSRSDGRAARHD